MLNTLCVIVNKRLGNFKNLNLSFTKYLLAGLLSIFLSRSAAQNSFYELASSKDHASGKRIITADTVIRLLNFAIPREVKVTRGNAGNGVLKFQFRTHNNKLVTCTYRGGASQTDPVNKRDISNGRTYYFKQADTPYQVGDVVTTDFVTLSLISGAPSFGITEARLQLVSQELPKEKISPPFPRLNGKLQKNKNNFSSGDPSLRTLSTETFSALPTESAVTSIPADPRPEELCANSLRICSPVVVADDAYSGNQDINQINGLISCLQNGSINGVWYHFTAMQTGQLNFTLKPEKLTDDFDWAVYDITNYSCGDITNISTLEIACNYSGIVGTNGWTGPNGNTVGGTQFSAPVNVVAGRTYKIFISNYSHGLQIPKDEIPARGFTLDMSQSLATGSSKYVFDDFSATIEASTNPICEGSSSQLKAIFAEAGQNTTYQWSPATGLNNPNIPNPIATPSVTTTYSFTITDNNSICLLTPPSITVNVLQPPAPSNIVAKGTTCKSAPTGEISFQLSGGAYAVRISGGSIAPAGEELTPVAGVYTRSGLDSATYLITTTGTDGCSSSHNVLVGYDGLTFSQMCDANVRSNVTGCSVAGISSTSTAGFTITGSNASSGTYTYHVYNSKDTRISPPNGYSGTINTPSAIPGLTSGTYRIEVTTSTGCIISTTDAGNRALKVEPIQMDLVGMLNSNQDTLLIPDNHVFKYCDIKCGENVSITPQLNFTNSLACTDLTNLTRTFKLFLLDAHGAYKLLLTTTSTTSVNTNPFTLPRGRLIGKYKIEASLENYGCSDPLLFEVQAAPRGGSRGDEMACKCHDLPREGKLDGYARQVQVYPNPVDHTLYVDVDGDAPFTAELRSLEGRLLKRSAEEATIGIDVSELSQGLYFLFVKTDKGIVVKRVEVLRER